MIKRKYFNIPGLILVTIILFYSTAFSVLQGANPPDHITLTWSESPMTTQTITWRTDSNITEGFVQYVLSTDANHLGESKYMNAVKAKTEVLTTEKNQKIFLHTAVLTGLKPETEYSYRVGIENNFSDINTFSTEPSTIKPFKFLLFGDSQSGADNSNYDPWRNTVNNAYLKNKDAKFIINMGDLVEVGQNYLHWEKWFDAAKGVIDNIPEMPVEGNHETYYSKAEGSGKPLFYMTQFKLPQNGPEGLKGQVYSYDYGNVHFIVLDSQYDEEKYFLNDLLEVQKKWLEQDLSSTKKEWKIVLFHKTPYYNSATRANEKIKAAFTPILDKYHVDIVFNGHDHGVSRTYPINHDQFVSKPSMGTIYYVTGRSGNKTYSTQSQKVWDAFFFNPLDQPCFELVTVDGDRLNVKSFKKDNTLIDDYTIDKASNTDSPQTILPPKYDSTRMVIYGNIVSSKLSPSFVIVNSNGKYEVPINSFVSFLNGTITKNDKGISIILGEEKESYFIPVDLIKNGEYVSAEELKAILKYSFKYDSSTNILYFTK